MAIDSHDNVACVKTNLGFFLLWGGQNVGEVPQKAAVRESLEECGHVAEPGCCLGVSDELVYAL
jgi:hypothetical protein